VAGRARQPHKDPAPDEADLLNSINLALQRYLIGRDLVAAAIVEVRGPRAFVRGHPLRPLEATARRSLRQLPVSAASLTK
jgi:hypothetical protein